MEQLKAKLKKQGGFTMVELLIVVAIIAILVAVSIPMFNNVLEKARHGVDQANYRDAQALAYAEYVGSSNPKEEFKDTGKTYGYVVNSDTHQGELVENGTGVTPQCTCTGCPTTANLGVTITIADGKPVFTFTGWKFDSTNSKTVSP